MVNQLKFIDSPFNLFELKIILNFAVYFDYVICRRNAMHPVLLLPCLQLDFTTHQLLLKISPYSHQFINSMLLLTGTDLKKTMSNDLDVLLCFSFRCFIVFLRKQNYVYRFWLQKLRMKFIQCMRAELICYIRKYGMETIINSQEKSYWFWRSNDASQCAHCPIIDC